MELGFHYFQGYFFQKPVMLHAWELPPLQIHALSLLREGFEDSGGHERSGEADQGRRFVSVSIAALFEFVRVFFSAEIRSVCHALMDLGEKQIRKWVALVVTLHAGAAGSSELVRTALTRARFCGGLAPKVMGSKRSGGGSGGSEDLFFLGLMSLLDVILEVSLPEILERVPISHEIKAALLGGAEYADECV
jgi:c-di-GMP phosphodiesterase